MDINKFWEVIEPGKNSEEPESNLRAELEKLSPEKIESFQAHFNKLFDDAYRWDLWGAAYMIHGGCSDDGFIDFRYALISKGKEVYERALANPDTLAELGEDVELLDNELFGYIAGEVYERKQGKDIPDTESNSTDSMGEEWDFDDEVENEKRLPNLFTIHAT